MTGKAVGDASWKPPSMGLKLKPLLLLLVEGRGAFA